MIRRIISPHIRIASRNWRWTYFFHIHFRTLCPASLLWLSSAAPIRSIVKSLDIWCKSNIRCPWWVNWSSSSVFKYDNNATASSYLKKSISKIAWRSLVCKTAKASQHQCQPNIIWVPTTMVKSSIKRYTAPWLVLYFIYVHLGQILCLVFACVLNSKRVTSLAYGAA